MKSLVLWPSCEHDLGPAQEEARRELLQMSQGQLEDVARTCNRYPDIQLTYQLPGGTSVAAGEQVQPMAMIHNQQARTGSGKTMLRR